MGVFVWAVVLPLFRLFPLGFWPMSMVSVVADDHWLYEEVSKRGRGCGANHGTEQQVFPKTQDAHPTLKMTAGPGCLSHRRPMMGMAQKKIADAVLQPVHQRHERQGDIMQGRSQDRCQNVTAREPGTKNRQQCFESKQRHKAEEDPYRHSSRDGLRRIADGQQL